MLAALEMEPDDRRAETGEQRLLASLFERALADARRGDAAALAWFATDERGPAERGWSYVDLCDHMALEPARGRAQVAQGARGRRPGRRNAREPRRLRAA